MYRPDIDGLRAIAVLSVLAFHAFPSLVRGGFVGVDVFFVISGFLITSIIWDSLQAGTFSYAEFYARRIKRLFPALLVVLAATVTFGWYVLLQDEYKRLGKNAAAGSAFVANFVLWGDSGYFSRAADVQPLLHLWSLSIEEQFYLVWPVLLGWTWARKWPLLHVALAIALASFAINVAFAEADPVATFYSPLSRAWELMLGGMVTCVLRQRPQLSLDGSEWLAVSGVLLVTASTVFLDEHLSYPGWWALLPTTGTLMLLSTPNTLVNRVLLGNRLLVGIGLISYPLYLWHWPLLSFGRIINGGECSIVVRSILLAASFGLAWATSLLIESRVRYSRSVFTIPALAVLMLTVCVGGLFSFRELLPSRNGDADLQRVSSALEDWSYPDGLMPITVNGHGMFWKKAGIAAVLFVGDSHVEQYSPRIVGLADQSESSKSVYFATTQGCPPVPDVFEDKHPECGLRRTHALRFAASTAIETVVVGGCWNCYFIAGAHGGTAGPNRYQYYILRDGRRFYFNEENGVAHALTSLEQMLRELAVTKRVYLLLDSPMDAAFSPETYIGGSRFGKMWFKSGAATIRYNDAQQRLRQDLMAVASRAGATVIDPIPTLCPQGSCLALTPDGRPIYKDKSHLRPFFVREAATFIDVAVMW